MISGKEVFTSLCAAGMLIFAASAFAVDPSIPQYSHIVVLIEENHTFKQIIGVSDAPQLNALAKEGALFTNSHGVSHPSLPNYYALYAGDTFGVTDDKEHSFKAPTLASAMAARGLRMTGYVEPASPRKHNPWESFADSAGVEKLVSEFPADFSKLPELSFVVPDLQNDMHDGTVAQGDAWYGAHVAPYAKWAKANNSLLIVTFDEDDYQNENRIPTIFYGAHVKQGEYGENVTHYRVLRTIADALGFEAPANGAYVKAITLVFE
jgi:acid phosphatase